MNICPGTVTQQNALIIEERTVLRKIAEFYLLGIVLTFAITILVGSTGAAYVEVFSLALLAWPTAILVMVARSRLARIREISG